MKNFLLTSAAALMLFAVGCDKAKDAANKAADGAAGAAGDAMDKAKGAAGDAMDKAGDAMDKDK